MKIIIHSLWNAGNRVLVAVASIGLLSSCAQNEVSFSDGVNSEAKVKIALSADAQPITLDDDSLAADAEGLLSENQANGDSADEAELSWPNIGRDEPTNEFSEEHTSGDGNGLENNQTPTEEMAGADGALDTSPGDQVGKPGEAGSTKPDSSKGSGAGTYEEEPESTADTAADETTSQSPDATEGIPPEQVKQQELIAVANACRKLERASGTITVASGNDTAEQTVGADSIVGVKVAGNKTKLDLEISGDSALSMKAVCLFVTGNQSSVTLDIRVPVAYLFYKARGNQSNGSIMVLESGSLGQTAIDLRGTQAELTIDGPGAYACGEALVSGYADGYSCSQ